MPYSGATMRLFLLLSLVAELACGATARSGAGPSSAAIQPSVSSFGQLFQADLAPISALVLREPFLWIGSSRGLRRIRLPAGDAAWVRFDAGIMGGRVSALAMDRAGLVLVATERGVGRLSNLDGRVREDREKERGDERDIKYQTVANLTGATHLAAVTRDDAGDGVWAGTAAGLFFLESGGSAVADPLRGVEITSLDLDGDGKSVWAGTRDRGLFHVDVDHVDKRQIVRIVASFGPESAAHLDFADVVGTALLPNGTRIAIGRASRGGTRAVLLRLDGAELLVAEPEIPVVAVVAAPGAPMMIAGEVSAPQLYRLAPMERGEALAGGGFRFSPAQKNGRKNWQGTRLAAHLDPIAVVPDVTVAVSGDAGIGGRVELFLGTRKAGVARLAVGKFGEKFGEKSAAAYLPVGELALDARRLSVACLAPDLCLLATGVGAGWSWNGPDRMFQPLGARAVGNGLMALAGDGAGTVYSVAGNSAKTGKTDKTDNIDKTGKTGKAGKAAKTDKKTDKKTDDVGAHAPPGAAGSPDGTGAGLAIGRLSDGGAKWDPLLNVSVQAEGEAIATFATVSPEGNLWIGIRDRSPSGQEFGLGVIEVQLPAGRVIHHRPYQANEERPPEAIPIAGDVTAVRFVPASGGDPNAIWFCTSLGVLRFAGADLSRWGENEGLDSERCHDLEITADHTIWAATERGVTRFDGQKWRRYDPAQSGSPSAGASGQSADWPVNRDGDGMTARALVASGHTLWAGTPRGVWPLVAAGTAATRTASKTANTIANKIDRSSGLIDDDVVDLVIDRFDRLWVLGHIGLSVRQMPR